ncbi:hypothetical protein O4H61_11050 [Roseovarius aestuarii]|nr:hypothetical protein [Roseovarius aestuarii]
METVTFKPALLARRITYHITPSYVARRSSDGIETWRVAYADLTDLGHVSQNIARTRTERLDLFTADGKRSISMNASYRAPDDPQYVAFRSTLDHLAAALHAARPDLSVTLGQRGGGRMMMFVIGVVTVLFAIGFAAVILGQGLSANRVSGVVPPLIAMLAFGGVISWTYRPVKTLASLPTATFAQTMEALAKGSATH